MKEERTYCRFCLGSCGLIIKNEEGAIKVRGDKTNQHSKGYLCRKGANISRYYDNLNSRIKDFYYQKNVISEEAFFYSLSDEIKKIIQQYGPNSIGVYFGTHAILDSSGIWTGMGFLYRIGSHSFFTVGSIDNIKKVYVLHEITRGANPGAVNVADEAKSDFCLIVGSNPVISNGHLYSNINFKKRLREHRKSGGYILCIDPRKTETAKAANLHLQVRPDTDHFILAFFVKSVLENLEENEAVERLFSKGDKRNLSKLRKALKDLCAPTVAYLCDIEESDLLHSVDKFLACKKLSFISGTGVSFASRGILTEWLLYVLCCLKGGFGPKSGNRFHGSIRQNSSSNNLDFSSFATKRLADGKAARETELPCSSITNLIADNELRALIVVGGNPVASFPSDITKSLASLDVLVCLNTHHDQTTKLATHLCPVSGPLERADSTAYISANITSGLSQYTKALKLDDNPIIPVWKFFAKLGDCMGIDVTQLNKESEKISTKNVISTIRGVDDDFFKKPPKSVDVEKLNLAEISLNNSPNILETRFIDELKTVLTELPVTYEDEHIFSVVSGRLNNSLNSANICDGDNTNNENLIYINDQDFEKINKKSMSNVNVISLSNGESLIGKLIPSEDIRKSCIWIPQSNSEKNVSTLCDSDNVCENTAMPVQTGFYVKLKFI